MLESSLSPLVFGTGNRKKAVELADLLTPLGLAWKTLADFSNALEVDETGTSFAENAVLKATRQAVHLGQWVLGDDSVTELLKWGDSIGIWEPWTAVVIMYSLPRAKLLLSSA